MELINDKTSFKFEQRKSYIDIFNNNYLDALNFYNNNLKRQGKTYKIQQLKVIRSFYQAEVCFITDKFFEFEETILDVLSQKKKSWQYLRLGYVYIQRQAWQDAIEVFKIAIKLQEQSQLSWLGLGISLLRIKEYSLAEVSFNILRIGHISRDLLRNTVRIATLILFLLIERSRFSKRTSSNRSTRTPMATMLCCAKSRAREMSN